MEANAIRAAMRAVPFRPFRLPLADGGVRTVSHPEWLALSPTGRQAALYQPDGSLTSLEPLLIVSLECAASEPPADAKKDGPVNGKEPDVAS